MPHHYFSGDGESRAPPVTVCALPMPIAIFGRASGRDFFKLACAVYAPRPTLSCQERLHMNFPITPSTAWLLLLIAGLLEIIWAVSMKA